MSPEQGAPEHCPFCSPEAARVFHEGPLVVGLWDAFPVNEGHALLVPRRHVADWFSATREERLGLLEAIDIARQAIAEEHSPDGYNVGMNIGRDAGQTVFHLHVHVIPRYRGDVADPTGGIRGVIPDRANYRRARPLATGSVEDPLVEHIRPLMARASEISIVAAFVQSSGLDVLQDTLLSALRRGAAIRILTGNYLNITQETALQRLLDWTDETRALREGAADEDEHVSGSFEARVIEVEKLRLSSFHPKAWLFSGGGTDAAFVGSSNVSRAALETGIEWNLRVDRRLDAVAHAAVRGSFATLWDKGTELTTRWVAGYRERIQVSQRALPPGELASEPLPEPPEPHELQRDALSALASSRRDGRERALVVMATGLGKTFMAALDLLAFRKHHGDGRVLFLAHRAELLRQAADTVRRVWRDAHFGWFLGSRSDLSGDVVFASVQKIARERALARIDPRAFDYVVVDEVHHAAAASYRRVLAHLQPRFLLGLTATPDRADEADVLALFDDHVPYRAGLGLGISVGMLVPFRYLGLRDTVDYAPIPWRNRRFDPVELARTVQTQDRMEQLWEGWQRESRLRTLIFCCSIAHTMFTRDWFRERGVRVEAVHSGDGSADRAEAVRALSAGELDALCTVDLFNEGIDIPALDRVVMLRPTESPVVFLQQLGRGLRTCPGKEDLLVIDFVGNHKVFLERLRTLLSLGGATGSVRELIEQGAVELPSGCSVQVELEAIELLRPLLSGAAKNEAVRLYRDLRDTRGDRPRAAELLYSGGNPRSLKHPDGWFGFVAEEGDLDEVEQTAWKRGKRWLKHLETSAMSKCFKMVTLQVLLEAEALTRGMSLDELARRSYAILRRTPDLLMDLRGVKELGPDVRTIDEDVWLRYWNKNPVHFWAGGEWFDVDGQAGQFISRIPRPTDPAKREALRRLTEELTDYRLARYRTRLQVGASANAFECRVISNQRDPIIKLPSREKRADIPFDWTSVRLEDGQEWQFRLMKEFCNVARPFGDQRNQLPDLLRGWFGPAAGRPGTRYSVRFSPSPDGWWIEPVGADVVPLPVRDRIVAYPTLRAAAGVGAEPTVGIPEGQEVVLPLDHADRENLFAVRAAGDSLDGGDDPIRDGDWVILQWARGRGLERVTGNVAMIAIADPEQGISYHLKRVAREDEGHVLRSDNPRIHPMQATPKTVVQALHVATIRPEDLAPSEGTQLTQAELASRFALARAPSSPWSRIDGHLFILVESKGILTAPDCLELPDLLARPGETAYVLTRTTTGDRWRYCGVGRQAEGGSWTVPALDRAAWTALGTGRRISRTLDSKWVSAAEELVQDLLAQHGSGTEVSHRGTRCRIVGPAPRGGIRIIGIGKTGTESKERTISLVDLAWVLAAQAHFGTQADIDEAHVNRVRYPEGTPKSSTRWIDTGFALTLVASAGQ